MEILKPSYYSQFECIGGKCKDTCCIGWQIEIDKKSYKKYKNVKGKIGERLNSCIKRNKNNPTDLFYGSMRLNEAKCQMLNEDNLCDIYINLGEEFLCNTCKQYPRLISKYGSVYEKTLSLSCPEVARFLVDNNEKFSFNLDEEELSEVEKQYIVNNDYNDEIYNLLWKTRALMIQVAQFHEIEVWKRILFIKLIEEKVQDRINNKDYSNIDSFLGALTENITNYEVIKSLDNIKKVNRVKINLIINILQKRADLGKTNHKFWSILEDFNYLFDGRSEDAILKLLDVKEEKFNNYFKEMEYVLENYIIYNLYNNVMKSLSSYDLNRQIVILILKFSIVKILLLAKWNRNNEVLKNEDIIDVLYSFSRVMEHNESFIDELYNDMKTNGYDSLAYLTILMV